LLQMPPPESSEREEFSAGMQMADWESEMRRHR
jgi:hypothetical protein